MYRDSIFYLHFTVKIRNVQISFLSRPLHSIKVICTEKLSEKNSEWPKMAIPNFPQKDWYKFGMAENGHSKFFPTIFPKKTGINLEWPKMAIPNFSQQFFPKRLV